jgi:hypothetical protein
MDGFTEEQIFYLFYQIAYIYYHIAHIGHIEKPNCEEKLDFYVNYVCYVVKTKIL